MSLARRSCLLAVVLAIAASCGGDGDSDDAKLVGSDAGPGRSTTSLSASDPYGSSGSPMSSTSGGSGSSGTSSTTSLSAASGTSTTAGAGGTSTTNSPEGARTLGAGTWGGDHAEMRSRSDGTTFEFDCAVGSVKTALAVAEDGSFEWQGTYVTERGNPNVQGEIDARPATYSGTVAGNTMTLTVDVPSLDIREGPFTLKEGARGFLRKCQ